MDCHDWSAWYNRMPGANDPKLHVSGQCSLPSSSIRVELVPGNEGIVDEPDLFVLELVVDEPDVGDTQFIERDITWIGNAGPDIERVRIQGAANALLEVFDAT